MPSTSKHHTDIDSRGNIKIDHSSIHQENATLSSSLNGKIANISRQKYLKSRDSDDALKEARREADEMTRLSSAIKKGEIKDSVSLYDKQTHTPKSRDGIGTPHNADVMSTHSESKPHTTVENRQRDPGKPVLSNFTMFAISMQKSKLTTSPIKTDNKVLQKNVQGYRSFMSLRCFSSPAYLRKDRIKRQRRPAIVRFQELKDGEVMEAQDIPVMKPEVAYAIQLRKRHVKSRRELQEMSKLEQEEKHNKQEKPEDFKQRKLAWAKGNNALNNRIKSFLTDVESFNKQQNKPDYLLGDIIRPKSDVVRAKTFVF